jgi:hypothetical protein
MAGAGGAGMAGNVILGGLIGAVVDANSGATRELVPNPLRVTLEPEAPPAPLIATAASPADAAPEVAAPVVPASATGVAPAQP